MYSALYMFVVHFVAYFAAHSVNLQFISRELHLLFIHIV